MRFVQNLSADWAARDSSQRCWDGAERYAGCFYMRRNCRGVYSETSGLQKCE
jgi:hypothetical protein